MEGIQGTRKRERSPAAASGTSVYFLVQFGCRSPWAAVDPNSGASETLPPAPFHSKDHYEAHHSIWVTGSVVIHDRFILVCVADSRVKNSCFYSYHWGSRVWKSVPTIDGVFYPAFGGTACVVGGRIFGCSSSAGVPLSYEFSVGDTREEDRDAPPITLGSPVLYRDLVELCPISPEELRERSGTIVPFGKDMLCFFHTFYGSFTFESQHLSIKILQIEEDPLSLKVLSSTSRALNIKGVKPATLSISYIPG